MDKTSVPAPRHYGVRSTYYVVLIKAKSHQATRLPGQAVASERWRQKGPVQTRQDGRSPPELGPGVLRFVRGSPASPPPASFAPNTTPSPLIMTCLQYLSFAQGRVPRGTALLASGPLSYHLVEAMHALTPAPGPAPAPDSTAVVKRPLTNVDGVCIVRASCIVHHAVVALWYLG